MKKSISKFVTTKKLKVKQYEKGDINIYRFDVSDGKLFKSIFMRIMESSDNLNFSDIGLFTHRDIEKDYGKKNESEYDDDILGMNLPPHCFIDFFNLCGNIKGKYKITPDEWSIYRWLLDNNLCDMKIYKKNGRETREIVKIKEFFIMVINKASLKTKKEILSVIKHEFSHAIYYSDTKYRKLVVKSWNSLTDFQRAEIVTYLHEKEYAPVTYLDEWAAFLIEKIPESDFRNWSKLENKDIDGVIVYFEKKKSNHPIFQ